MRTQRCCAHCPGKLSTSRCNSSHECCQPNYVSGNLRVSSLKKQPPCHENHENAMERYPQPSPEDRATCYNKFALAKRLHAENLEHQPLPDKVDDSIFKNFRPKKTCDLTSSSHQHQNHAIEGRNGRYGSVLGCKKPETRMDLAICWDTPINPTYEPSKPTHIDGSEGGPAPAIFALIQHSPNPPRTRLRSASESNDREGRGETDHRKRSSSSSCECACKDLDQVNVSKEESGERSPSKRSYRQCYACERRNSRTDDPRLIKSAVGLASGKSGDGNRRNGLAPRGMVPRPRTPFAKRSFCIDTLAPPFSVVNGCRDADYPEHWRLMTIYQRSYQDPHKRRFANGC